MPLVVEVGQALLGQVFRDQCLGLEVLEQLLLFLDHQ
jgi:hypothetical protein